ncbi:N-acetylglucosaminyltransferase [Conoideocrella luteorostrata]|uniref:N-acetylglucosaminyltransferase n=1 Tax=Conoideocrella luteorostrata TaxID=1105319 RepID=A0AAJ0FXI2_9HYPO|nr:N-acetylglucosaminyltransferase [Conoideocrella luteorostrata]
MLFEILNRLGSRAERLMMYPSNMLPPDASTGNSDDARLLIKARDEYKVRLRPIQVQHRSGSDPTWADSFTKLLAFNQTEYTRVLSLDSDATILQPMDELFLLPPCPVAMPRAYWLYPDKQILSSQVMLVQPSVVEFERIMAEVERSGSNDYDMEIVNNLYKDQALILPHRPYDMLTAEFRTEDHAQYLGSDREKWDPVAMFNEAKFLHFSDWPVPKPWIKTPDSVREEKQPKCHESNGVESCVERQLWNGFYTDFAERRQVRDVR